MSDDDVHYRLYRGRDERPVVVCVQWFDYPDYDPARFLTEERYATESEAEAALRHKFLRGRVVRVERTREIADSPEQVESMIFGALFE